jgi:hypothetical protein
MSDHVDGPRSIGDPAADLTDLFAFTSPENPAHTVLAACVFPSAGEDAMFSNIINYSIAVHRVPLQASVTARRFSRRTTRSALASSSARAGDRALKCRQSSYPPRRQAGECNRGDCR